MKSKTTRFLLPSLGILVCGSLLFELAERFVATAYGMAEPGGSQSQSSRVSPAGTVSSACGTASGTRFNLERRNNPVPQNETAVDFLPGAGLSGADLIVGGANDFRLLTSGTGTPGDFRGVFGLTNQTGYYVHRNGADSNPCAADFEGGLPSLTSPLNGDTLVGVGDPAVAADVTRQVFFLADERVGEGEVAATAIAIFRSTPATLTNSTLCPDGTQTEASARQCWPTSVLVDLQSAFSTDFRPNLAVDERPDGSGVGAGNVYVSGARTGGSIFIAACRSDLSACSPGITISGSDFADLPHIAVRPDGGITATYSIYTFLPEQAPKADIKWVTCTPKGAPKAPTCAASTLITTETRAIPYDPFGGGAGVEAAQFVMHTFPKHTHRQDANGIETYVVWDRCKVSTAVVYPGVTFADVCPDADLVMAASNNNGQTWTFGTVDTGVQDQFQPWVTTDTSTNIVNIAYYSSQSDAFQHRSKILLRQILPGSSTPDPVSAAQIITTVPMDPAADSFLQGIYIGDYIGLAARGVSGGSRAYIHYTHTAITGTYNGVKDPEENNHLSRFDY
jgi:hypothetical protein